MYIRAEERNVFRIVNKPQDALDAILEFEKKLISANHEHEKPIFSI